MSDPTPPARQGLVAPMTPTPPTQVPWLGLVAVLMGTFISTLNNRLSNVGLADIRGAVSAGFDEGAWITTAQTVGSMFVTLLAVWMGATYGPRKVLVWTTLAFAILSILIPFSPNLDVLLALQFLSGCASGFFIPLTLSYILLNMPPKYWAFGIALYALNLELSLNISASLEGYYIDYHSWRWIFWQNVPLALIMSLCLHYGVHPSFIRVKPPRDVFALVAGGTGLGIIYAALDQGNRLDWLNSGLIWGLIIAGAVLLVALVVHEARTPNPLINLKFVVSYPIPSQIALISFLRLTITATSYLIPLYLNVVRGYRELEVGQALVWIAIPQLIFCPLAGLMLRRSDPRLVGSIGFMFISAACLMVAYEITPLWGTDQFIPSAVLQALGQGFALSGVVYFGILHVKPQDALTFGAVLQTSRLMGGEVGTAFVTTFARKAEQVSSNLIGLHVQNGDLNVIQRIEQYAAITMRTFDPTRSMQRGTLVLGDAVRSAATIQAVMDTFVAIAFFTAIALLVFISRRAPPEGPASPKPVFPVRPAPGKGDAAAK
jgi:MFS transporter, DHA2 family, multidrug resistance protein